jgi:hypothetical protein
MNREENKDKLIKNVTHQCRIYFNELMGSQE